MKLFICLILFLSSAVRGEEKEPALDSVLLELDETIKDHAFYEKNKEMRILELKSQASNVPFYSSAACGLNEKLYDEYLAYQCDSALFYLNRSIEIAEYLQDNTRKTANLLQLSYLMGSSGMYKESIDILDAIDRRTLPGELLEEYYSAQLRVYGELGYYTQNKKKAGYYTGIAQAYRDSLLALLPDTSDHRLVLKEESMRYYDQTEALKINDFLIQKTRKGTREHAIVSYRRAMIFQQLGDTQSVKYWLAQSALSDIQSAVKDHASLWMLAQILHRENDDVDRAYSYIRFSWSETMFYNARLRNLQSSVILSLIDDTYQIKMTQKNHQLQNYLIIIALIMVILLVAMYFIFRQTRRLSDSRGHLQAINQQLNDLNVRLQESNINLQESNQIKEEYIGRFLKLCSTYIENLDTYRKMVNRMIRNGQIEELVQLNFSQSVREEEREELYASFDEAFLRFYPHFIEQVNALLTTPIVPKENEILNTELRVLALIRLGINSGVQIADFLHYSVNTIYNLRAKLKNRAIGSREEFENQVKKIR
jgi:hypothetical protein